MEGTLLFLQGPIALTFSFVSTMAATKLSRFCRKRQPPGRGSSPTVKEGSNCNAQASVVDEPSLTVGLLPRRVAVWRLLTW